MNELYPRARFRGAKLGGFAKAGAAAAEGRPFCHVGRPGGGGAALPAGPSLAMVYAPEQDFSQLYDVRQGLCKGTIFMELDKPFLGSGR